MGVLQGEKTGDGAASDKTVAPIRISEASNRRGGILQVNQSVVSRPIEIAEEMGEHGQVLDARTLQKEMSGQVAVLR